MRTREEEPAAQRCPNCGAEITAYGLRRCSICRGEFCGQCAVTGYGRDFCSTVCRGYFFPGDMEDLGEEE